MIDANKAASKITSQRVKVAMDSLQILIIKACEEDATETYITVPYDLWQVIRLELVALNYQTESIGNDQYKVKWGHLI
jgi:hypothetical protein